MNSMLIYGIIITIVILLFYIILICSCAATSQKLFTGFWQGDPSFCDEAELELFICYIGKKQNNTYPIYVLAKNSDGFIINDQAELSLTEHYTSYNNISLDTLKQYKVAFDGIDYDYFPTNQTLTYYPSKGKIVLSSDDEIHIVLYKSNIMSDLPNEE